MKRVILFCALLVGSRAGNDKFPEEFIFGVGSSSYQIEGAWNADGKTENIWDHLVHTNPGAIRDESNADIACDSYHNYKQDVQIMRQLGVDAYRISISWTRILPTGFPNKINAAGVEFYNNYFNELLMYNITPVVTLYHWDLPQSLQDLGGIANPLFADWFEDYARVVFDLFGDRVKIWITFNEPKQICFNGYSNATVAPMVYAHGFGEYICAKNLIIANARAYHLYNRKFRAQQDGKVGYTVDVPWFTPETDSEEDRIATELKKQADWAIYSDPIFSAKGGWPEELENVIAVKSAAQGFQRSRLPEFTPEEKQFVHGTADFYGINHYTSSKVSAINNLLDHPVPSLLDDIDVGIVRPADSAYTGPGNMPQVPEGMYNVIKELYQRYTDTVFFITECGTATPPGLDDDNRVQFYRDILEYTIKALDDGIPLKGFMAWCLMDNFEWTFGYTLRFGLYDVDFNNPARTRTPKKSAYVYKHIIKHRMIDRNYQPNVTMPIDSYDYYDHKDTR